METIELTINNPAEAFKRMQKIREKVHLDYASHEEIEEPHALEYSMQDLNTDTQSEFWV
jgi:hypothetical protein